MGRPRQFNEERAVEAACRVFWDKGFDGASTEDLRTATGLNRSSLYNTFESKEHLFQLALTQYITRTTTRHNAFLEESSRTGLERIHDLLTGIVDDEVANQRAGEVSGCFTVNTITSLAARNPEVATIIDVDLSRRLGALAIAVDVGQRDGSIDPAGDPDDMAWFVTTLISGMRVSAQSGADRRLLDSMVVRGLRGLAS